MKTLHDKNIGLRLIELLCIETSLFEKRLYIIHIHITFDASVTDKEYVQCEEHIYILRLQLCHQSFGHWMTEVVNRILSLLSRIFATF